MSLMSPVEYLIDGRYVAKTAFWGDLWFCSVKQLPSANIQYKCKARILPYEMIKHVRFQCSTFGGDRLSTGN